MDSGHFSSSLFVVSKQNMWAFFLNWKEIRRNKEMENWLNDESYKALLFFIVPLGSSEQKLHE